MKKLSPEQRIAVLKAVQVICRDLAGLAGAVSVVVGVGMIYVPAALIVGGVAAVVGAYLLARRSA